MAAFWLGFVEMTLLQQSARSGYQHWAAHAEGEGRVRSAAEKGRLASIYATPKQDRVHNEFTII